MYLFLGEPVHDHPEGLVWAERYDAEPLGLSIGPILEELDVLEVGDANVGDGVSDILVRRPLKTGAPKTQRRIHCRTHKIHTYRAIRV